MPVSAGPSGPADLTETISNEGGTSACAKAPPIVSARMPAKRCDLIITITMLDGLGLRTCRLFRRPFRRRNRRGCEVRISYFDFRDCGPHESALPPEFDAAPSVQFSVGILSALSTTKTSTDILSVL